MAAATPTTTVTVAGNWQVVYGGTTYVPGETIDLDPDEARRLIASGFVVLKH